MTKAYRVLLLSPDEGLHARLSVALAPYDLQVNSYREVHDLRHQLAASVCQVCFIDWQPGARLRDLLAELKQRYPGVLLALLEASPSRHDTMHGLVRLIRDPLDLTGLNDVLNSLGQASGLAQALLWANSKPLLGISPGMQILRKQIFKLSKSHAAIHIHGPSGSGKELVAQAIHDASRLAKGPFIAVNCGAIPKDLMESEFFGFKRGSFTGATMDKLGLIASAEGGTLFLDEIAELPLDMQVKLLRVIDTSRVRALGALHEVQVNTRILSASHQNLSKLVMTGRFREDLFYRISMIEIRVPALHERAEDIPLLVDAILSRLVKRYQMNMPSLDQSARQALQSYAYPGNVRELENILERALHLCEHNQITSKDLQLKLMDAHKAEPELRFRLGQDSLETYINQMTRQIIIQALQASRWNKRLAAQLLNLPLRTLRYQIKKFSLDETHV